MKNPKRATRREDPEVWANRHSLGGYSSSELTKILPQLGENKLLDLVFDKTSFFSKLRALIVAQNNPH